MLGLLTAISIGFKAVVRVLQPGFETSGWAYSGSQL